MSRIDFSKIPLYDDPSPELVAELRAALDDPALPSEDLETLFYRVAMREDEEGQRVGYHHGYGWSHAGVVEAIARHPNTPARVLSDAFGPVPEEVAANPVLSLLALQDPGWARGWAPTLWRPASLDVQGRLFDLMRWPAPEGPSRPEVAKAFRAILAYHRRRMGAARFHRWTQNAYDPQNPYGESLASPSVLERFTPDDNAIKDMLERWELFGFTTDLFGREWTEHVRFLRMIVRRFDPLFASGPKVSVWTLGIGEERKVAWSSPALTVLDAIGF